MKNLDRMKSIINVNASNLSTNISIVLQQLFFMFDFFMMMKFELIKKLSRFHVDTYLFHATLAA